MRLITIAFTLLASTVAAQDYASCLEFSNDTRRLECFDSAAGYEPSLETASSASPWLFVESRDDFTNRNTSSISIRSDRSGVIGSDAPETAFVRCDGEGGYDVFVVSGGYIGARNNRVPVRYKFGQDEPISERWNESTNGTAAFLPNGYRDFIAGLISGRDFLFELTDFRGSRYSANFQGIGPDTERLNYILSGCQ